MSAFAKGLATQSEVVYALIMRETRTRFGKHRLGYVWALVEPSLLILTFYALFAMGGRDAPSGMDHFGFLATGIVPYLLFNHSAQRIGDAISGNRGMLFYPHVQPIDLVIARSLLEAVTYAAVFLVLMGIRALYYQELAIDDPLPILIGFALASMLGTSLGMIFCGLSLYSSAVERVRGPMLRPFFWVSGIFFTANSLPDSYREVLLWNPVLHITEYVRGGSYESYTNHFGDAFYPLAWALGLALVGLSLERVVRRRIELT